MRISRVLALLPLCLTLTGCLGQDSDDDVRSVENFCDTMELHKQRYTDTFAEANANLDSETPGGFLMGLLGAGTAVGDLAIMWRDLAKVAPEEIQSDVERIRDSYEEQLDSSGDMLANPLSRLGNALGTSISTSGSYQRVFDYADQKC